MPKRVVDLRSQAPLLDIVSYARRGPGQRFTVSQRQAIARTVGRVPEVMIKVGHGGATVGAIAAHLRYLNRRGELEIETDDREQLMGRGVERIIVDDWDLALEEEESVFPYFGVPGRKRGKLVHKLTFSMPAGTPPEKLLAAVRNFATEKWALKHRYLMVLHTDQPHPHVHVVLKAVSEQGERLNIRKATLREWRRDFAASLREQGVAANATERAVRGESRSHKTDAIYRAMRRGDSTHYEERTRLAARALRSSGLPAESGGARLLATRGSVQEGWRAVGDLLERDREILLAEKVRTFIRQMSRPRTELEQIQHDMRARELSR